MEYPARSLTEVRVRSLKRHPRTPPPARRAPCGPEWSHPDVNSWSCNCRRTENCGWRNAGMIASNAAVIGTPVTPSVGVVFTTYNRPQDLARVLAGYARQTHPQFEIVIADDGSGEE